MATGIGCEIISLPLPRWPVVSAALSVLKAPLGGLELGPDRELAPDPPRLSKVLKRAVIARAGALDDDDLVMALEAEAQGMVIVNSRAHALALFRRAKAAGLDGTIHLTTRQYAAHRRTILEEVRERLNNKRPCRLIATSLVEAGIDIDFPRVWRAEAGLDQITQAAGRCNREGRWDVADSVVTVFTAPDHKPPREIKLLADDLARMADKHPDLLSLDAMREYFREVYWRMGDQLDAKKILNDFKLDRSGPDIAYRTVAEKFRIIESGLSPVIVARDDPAKKALAKLNYDTAHPGSIARDLQPYVVQAPPKARAMLLAKGHVVFAQEKRCGEQFAVLSAENLYKNDTGLLWEDSEYLELENSLI